jgi:hypothetical protein
MTKRIINIIIFLTFGVLLYKPFVESVNHLKECPNGVFETCEVAYKTHETAKILRLISFFAILLLCGLYFSGCLDNYINKNIEPKVNQFYEFLNRRNK